MPDKMPWEFGDEEKLIIRRRITQAMGMPLERLRSIVLLDAGALDAGRTQAQFNFDPELTKNEAARFERLMRFYSLINGGRPPIFVGQG